MGRTCGEPDEIKKNTHPKNITALFREQDPDGGLNLTQFWSNDVRSPTGEATGGVCNGGGNTVSTPMPADDTTALAAAILAPYPKPIGPRHGGGE